MDSIMPFLLGSKILSDEWCIVVVRMGFYSSIDSIGL